MKSIKQQVEDLGDKIVGDLHHGECFYNSKMLVEFLHSLDKMKQIAKKYYHQNKAEMEDDET